MFVFWKEKIEFEGCRKHVCLANVWELLLLILMNVGQLRWKKYSSKFWQWRPGSLHCCVGKAVQLTSIYLVKIIGEGWRYVFLGTKMEFGLWLQIRKWTMYVFHEALPKVFVRTQYLKHMAPSCFKRRAAHVRTKETELRTAKTKKEDEWQKRPWDKQPQRLARHSQTGLQETVIEACKKQAHRVLRNSHKGLQETATRAWKQQPQRLARDSHKGLKATATKACKKQPQRLESNSHTGLQETATKAWKQ